MPTSTESLVGILVSGMLMACIALVGGVFVHIAASDLLPEIEHSERLDAAAVRFVAFVAGAALLFLMRSLGA